MVPLARQDRRRQAEGVGFEPTEHCCSHVFETRAFGRTMLPLLAKRHYSTETHGQQNLPALLSSPPQVLHKTARPSHSASCHSCSGRFSAIVPHDTRYKRVFTQSGRRESTRCFLQLSISSRALYRLRVSRGGVTCRWVTRAYFNIVGDLEPSRPCCQPVPCGVRILRCERTELHGENVPHQGMLHSTEGRSTFTFHLRSLHPQMRTDQASWGKRSASGDAPLHRRQEHVHFVPAKLKDTPC